MESELYIECKIGLLLVPGENERMPLPPVEEGLLFRFDST